MPHKINDFQIKGDQRGSLVAFEQNRNIPFDIKRVYYIFDTKSEAIRGKHAHKKLEQILICVAGECDVSVEEKNERKTYHLGSQTAGLYIGGLVWREMKNFSPDAVLLVLASDYYNEEDYIRDYNEFQKLSKVLT